MEKNKNHISLISKNDNLQKENKMLEEKLEKLEQQVKEFHKRDCYKKSNIDRLRVEIWKLALNGSLSEKELIYNLLEKIGKMLNFSRAAYSVCVGDDYKKDNFECIIEWDNKEVPSLLGAKLSGRVIKYLLKKDINIFNLKNALSFIPKSKTVFFRPILENFVKKYNIDTITVIPYYLNKKIVGILTFDIYKKKKNSVKITDEVKKIIIEALSVISTFESKKMAEEELEKYQQKLEKLVEERTKKIQQVNKQLKIEITERKQTEIMLRKSEEKYRDLVEHSNSGVCIIQDYKVKYVNKHLTDMVGIQLEDAIDIDYIKFIWKTEIDRVNKFYEKLMSGEDDNQRYETYLKHKDGNKIDVDLNVSAYNYEGKRAAFVIVHDINEKKRVELELLKAQKLESLGILAGGIAHDFNNILTAILGNINLAMTYTLSEGPVFESLAEAEKASIRAKDLTRQLLTFSKGGEPIKKITNLSKIVKDTVLFALRGTKVKSNIVLQKDLWSAEVDEGQIDQVLSNLTINAIQAMKGGGELFVSAENWINNTDWIYNSEQYDNKEWISKIKLDDLRFKNKRYIKIEIRDTGKGISETNINKIFDPYFTTKDNGSGLGLSTAYSIIKRHNGFINVESKINKGTSFQIFLPATGDQLNEKQMDKLNNKYNKKGKILVIDDELYVRKTAALMLSRFGYESQSASSGENGVELYKNALINKLPFDLVIIDLTIPGGIGGLEIINMLLSIDPKVKAIVSSGYSNDPVLANYDKYGFMGVLEKPYTIEEMGEKIENIIVKN